MGGDGAVSRAACTRHHIRRNPQNRTSRPQSEYVPARVPRRDGAIGEATPALAGRMAFLQALRPPGRPAWGSRALLGRRPLRADGRPTMLGNPGAGSRNRRRRGENV